MGKIRLNESPSTQVKRQLRVTKAVSGGGVKNKVRQVLSGKISAADAIKNPENLVPGVSRVMSLINKAKAKSPKYYTPYGSGVSEYLVIRTEKTEESLEFDADNLDSEPVYGDDDSIYGKALKKFNTTKTKTINEFLDLSAIVNISNKNNVIMTQTQGRDTTRKEYISGGDFFIEISGTIANKEDKYPEEEVAMLIEMLKPNDETNKVLSVECPHLNRFDITGMIVLDYKFPQTAGYSNIQKYQIKAVAEKPLKVLEAEEKDKLEKVQAALRKVNEWVSLNSLIQ